MRILRILAMVLALGSWGLAQANSPAFQLFEQALRFVDTQYFGPSQLNVLQLGEKYRAQLLVVCTPLGEACGYEKAEPLIALMLAELEDRHAYYLTAAAVQARNATIAGTNNSPVPVLGFSHIAVTDAQQKLVSFDRLIVNVLPGSPADLAGLRYGDRWLGYDGIMFSSLANDSDLNQALQGFTTKVRSGQPLSLLMVRGLERQRLEVRVQGAIFNQVQFPTLTVRPDKIAVLRLRTFLANGVGQRVHDLIAGLSNQAVTGLILDMRGNGGGLASERWYTAGALIENPEPQRRVPRYSPENGFEESYSLGRFIVRTLGGQESVSRLEFYTQTSLPLAVLVDGGCASACEFLSSSFRRAKRAIIIGEPTVGIGSTNTQPFSLLNGGAVSLPTLRSFWTDGTPLPARIVPDFLTPQFELELFNSGRDLVMEKALEVLNAPKLKSDNR
jgi:carboxyl-terminal processing protease